MASTTLAVPSAPALRPVAASDSPPRARWAYPFGLFQAASHSADSLVLLYAATLGASLQMVALIDALGSMASVLGLLVLGRLADRLGSRGWLFMAPFGCAGLAALGLATATTPLVLLAMAIVWGFVFVGPMPLASVFITRRFRPAAWASQQIRHGSIITVGAAVGLAASIAWLGGTKPMWGEVTSMRGFFLIAAGASFVAALAAGLWLRRSGAAGAAPAPPPRETAAPYNDRLKALFLVTTVSFLGMGMAGTLLPVYLIRELHAEGYKVMAASLAFMLAGSLAFPSVGRIMSRLLPLRLFALAVSGRGLLLLFIGAAGLLLPNSGAQALVILLMAGCGVCSAMTLASSSTRLVSLAPFGRKGIASGQNSALSFTAMAAGAVLAGAVAQHLGFFAAYALAASLLFSASALALRL